MEKETDICTVNWAQIHLTTALVVQHMLSKPFYSLNQGGWGAVSKLLKIREPRGRILIHKYQSEKVS